MSENSWRRLKFSNESWTELYEMFCICYIISRVKQKTGWEMTKQPAAVCNFTCELTQLEQIISRGKDEKMRVRSDAMPG